MKFNFNKRLISLATSVLLACGNVCFAMNHPQPSRWDINNKHDKSVNSESSELQDLMPLTIFDITENEVKQINLGLPKQEYNGVPCISTGSISKDQYVFEREGGNPKQLRYFMADNSIDIGNVYVYFGCSKCDSDLNNPWPPRLDSDFLKAVTYIDRNGDINEANRYLISITDALAEMTKWGNDRTYGNFFLYHTCFHEALEPPHVSNGHIYVIVEGEICDDRTKRLNKDKVDWIVSRFQGYLKYCLERVRKTRKGYLLGSGN